MELSFAIKIKSEALYAGFWKRVVAHLFDTIILLFYNLIIVKYVIVPLVGITMPLFGFDANNAAEHYIIAATGFLGWMLYYAFFESSSKQGTLGKQLMKIVVVDLDYKRISFVRALGRALILECPLAVANTTIYPMIRLLVFVIWLCMTLAVVWTKKSQGLHDILAGCLVINRDAVIPEPDLVIDSEN
jgi:uncharacterized RDD family membrane protein YckC